MKRLYKPLAAAAVCALALHGAALAQGSGQGGDTYEPTVGQQGKDVVWVPTSQALVDRMLDMAKLTPQDVHYDLGSGDGRTVITAARRGAKSTGIEYNPDMVALSQRNAKAAGVGEKAVFKQADIFETDFSDATVLTLFLLPDLNMRLRPTILDMKPGTRVVSNSFTMSDWEPDETAVVEEGCSSYCTAYKWVVPAKVAGAWSVNGQPLTLEQSFQRLGGTLQDQPISDARMDGANIRFVVGGDEYVGTVEGDTMKGTVNGAKPWSATRG